MDYTIQVSPEDCTGCALCVDVCPAKNKSAVNLKAINMRPQPALREQENANWDFFLGLPEMDRRNIKVSSIRQQQVQQPLFEFSGACAGCGETPYLKLISQLFGDRSLIANATGCSSIYGGNLPTTPWSKNEAGKGPAWANSLFEDNAEFGLGMRVALDKRVEYASELLKKLSSELGEDLVTHLLTAEQSDEMGIYEQRARVAVLKEKLEALTDPEAKRLLTIADDLVKRDVWIVGGDGWAYDIGYGGLDHVLSSGRNVNVLVLDTEVYSNTGGQASKATPRAAVAKFAASGKGMGKKDLGMIAMSYGHIYVARVALGANDAQALRAFLEADAYDGPSLIIAYSHCIAHGIDMKEGLQQQKLAVQAGVWPLYRFNPALTHEGKPPLVIDSKAPTIPVEDYAYRETRYRMLTISNEARAEELMQAANEDARFRWERLQKLAAAYAELSALTRES